MSGLPKRENLDPKQASAIDFAVAQDRNFYVSGAAAPDAAVAWRPPYRGFGVLGERALPGGRGGRGRMLPMGNVASSNVASRKLRPQRVGRPLPQCAAKTAASPVPVHVPHHNRSYGGGKI